MKPSNYRCKQLRERFGVDNGRFFGDYRFKNLNWYFCTSAEQPREENEWFCYGDITDEDIPRLCGLLEGSELLALGWKDMSPDVKRDQFGDGGGIWIVLNCEGVVYDKRAKQ